MSSTARNCPVTPYFLKPTSKWEMILSLVQDFKKSVWFRLTVSSGGFIVQHKINRMFECSHFRINNDENFRQLSLQLTSHREQNVTCFDEGKSALVCIAILQVYKLLSLGSQNFRCLKSYNQFHNILRLRDVFPIIPVTTSETMGDYYL